MRELVSVIIPVFNRAYCIGDALRSVAAQTHASWEAIVVDDGSTDATARVIDSFRQSDARVRYHYQANAGVAAARNAGLAIATGSHIAFLDSDDRWKPWKLEAQLACLRHMPDIGMIWTDMEAVDPAGAVLCNRYLRRMYGAYKRLGSKSIFSQRRDLDSIPEFPRLPTCDSTGGSLSLGYIYDFMFLGNLVHTSTVLMTRERFERVKGFDETLTDSGEDYDFHLRTCRAGDVGLLDIPSIYYRVGAQDQLTRPSYHLRIAQNALVTVRAALSQDRDTISLSKRRQRGILARLYKWVGEELFQLGQFKAARGPLAQSFLYFPLQVRILLLCSVTFLPAGMIALLRRSYRHLHMFLDL